MRAVEVIKRFSELQAEVQGVFGYGNAADCFCGQSGFGHEHVHSDHYRNEGEALRFIEEATREALQKRRAQRQTGESR